MNGKFFIVATPIGNLSDITLRAIKVLENVDYIACEDTRITKILTSKYNINAKLIDCHKFNEKQKSQYILTLLQEGKSGALVSDAGTPLISDPGAYLLQFLRDNGIEVTSIPGACAVTTFLTLVPRETEEYAFIGFAPRTLKQQIQIFNKHRYTNCVFYESPNRLLNTLENIKSELGGQRKIAVGRELTKVFEEIKIGTTEEIIEYYNKNPLKGECVGMIFADNNIQTTNSEILEKIEVLKSEGFSQRDISKIISSLFNINKNQVYKLMLKE